MIRQMTQNDIPSVVQLENVCFLDAWSECLIAESFHGSLDHWYLEEEAGRLCGYCVLRVIAGEGEIQRIAVRPDCRKRGIGRKLMEQMVRTAREQGVGEITLEVRCSNRQPFVFMNPGDFEKRVFGRTITTIRQEDAMIMWNHHVYETFTT